MIHEMLGRIAVRDFWCWICGGIQGVSAVSAVMNMFLGNHWVALFMIVNAAGSFLFMLPWKAADKAARRPGP